MRKFSAVFTMVWGVAALVCLHPAPALACAACYGQSDSPMAAGMNWGIMSLLVMIALVLAGVAGFFVYLAKKSAATAAADPGALAETAQPSTF